MEYSIGQGAIFFRYIYKGTLVKISENIAFLFYKEISMKYLIRKQTRDKQDGGIILNTCCKEKW
jgi:hypothetical protein